MLNGVHTVRVKVLDSSGKPVKGVETWPVTIFKRGKLFAANVSASAARAATDEHGVATLDWFPRNVEQATAMYVFGKSCSVPSSPILDADKLDAEVIARVLRFTPIWGKVTRVDGSPAAGVRVEAQGRRSESRGLGERADGRRWFLFDGLPPNQSYLVYVVDDDLAAPSRTGVVLHEGKGRAGVDFRLRRGSLIHGRVTAGPESQPAPGVTVMLYENGPAVPDRTFANQPRPLSDQAHVADTDSEGRYAFRVGPGHYELTGPRAGRRTADRESRR